MRSHCVSFSAYYFHLRIQIKNEMYVICVVGVMRYLHLLLFVLIIIIITSCLLALISAYVIDWAQSTN